MQQQPRHEQARLTEESHSLAIEQIETYDDARQSGLVVDCEHESLSGTGTLAGTQHFDHAYVTAIARRRAITAAQHATQGPGSSGS